MAQMTLDELRALTDQEIRSAVGYFTGRLAQQRQKGLQYYLAEPVGDLAPPEIEGRSTVVSPVVRNTVESMLPQLMVKFAGSEHPVEFQPQKPGDEEKAEQATDYISYLYNIRNNGERITYNWMKDALISKNGVIKVWWDTRSIDTREEYVGLTEVELAQLLDDGEIEVTEQKAYPDEEDAEKRQEALLQLQQQLGQVWPQGEQAARAVQQQIAAINAQPPAMLYDVVCKRSKEGGRVCVENVPPEEFLISRLAKSLEDAPFVGHRVARSVSDLRSMGYKNIDQISGDDQSAALSMEAVTRKSWDDEMAWQTNSQGQNLDDSQRMVWVTECYVRVDYDGDGIAELRKVVRAGNQVLENEIVDLVPFVDITPVPMPHRFFGLSIADLAATGQRVETALLRGVLDNQAIEVNGRFFAVEGQVNLDDLLTSRPGGIVRVKSPQAVGRLDQGTGNSPLGLQMLEYMKGYNEDSTGWTRYNQGTDGDSLNQTATGATLVTNRADMRLDLIARNFAEGFKRLFRLMLKLVSQYQQKEDVIQLRGKWVAVNPRDWRNGFETTCNVGLGTGSKDQLMAHLTLLMQHQGNAFQLGLAQPKQVYNLMAELCKAMGFKSADKFFTDPGDQPPPPKPDPEQAKLQAQGQIEQMKAQLKAQTDTQAKQAELQLERERMQMQAQVDAHRQQVEAQQQAVRMQQERELAEFKARLDAETRSLIEQMRAESAERIAKINAEAKLIGAQVTAQTTATAEQDNAADAALNDDA